MPMHDWSRVDANVYHHFHQRWIIAISDHLNAGALPPGYSALVEQHAAGLVPDVLGLERHSPRGRGWPVRPTGGAVVAIQPQTRHVFESRSQALTRRANRVVIRHRLGEVVCMIEIVSPGNKAGQAAMQAFAEKTHEFLQAGVNVLVVDPFPPTRRDPNGLHPLVWRPFADDPGEPFTLPPDKPLLLAAYVVDALSPAPAARAYVEPVAVGDTLRDMPAFLDPDHHVPVPLELTYQAAWAACPSDMRYLVEHGSLPGEPESETGEPGA